MQKPGLVIGGGIAGMQASLDLADQGFKVYLVEMEPSIGGNMAKLDKTFPTLDCAACIITPKLVDTGKHKRIELLTYSEVEEISGTAGDFKVKVRKKARYVDEEACTGCGECTTVCPVSVPNKHDAFIGSRKAAYVSFPQAVPLIYTIDREHCIGCGLCEIVCQPEAIRFDQEDEILELEVGAIIMATGFQLDDPKKKTEFGFGVHPDVITSLQLERLLSPSGPTGGHVRRPSDGETPKRVGFAQCVCSRDTNTNLYCSRFCCMYATKEGILIKEHEPDTDVTIFYIDIRAFGKGYEEFYNRAHSEYGIKFMKGRISEVSEQNGTVVVRSEDVVNGGLSETELDLLILAVGAVPTGNGIGEKVHLPLFKDGFFEAKNPYIDAVETEIEGVFIAGSGEGPKDIPDTVTQASAAAMKASIILGGT
ncbi:MAG: FAD-dependent oxidoreductase [Candidatus Hydrothermarchaeaceae archaeon]